MGNNVIIDFVWELIKSYIPEKAKKVFDVYMEKALEKLNKFTEESLIDNKKIIESLGKCSFFACVLFTLIKCFNMAIGSFAVAICLFMLSDSICYYLNIKKILGNCLVQPY